MVENQVVDKKDFEIYSYGVELIIAYLVYFTCLLLVAALTNTIFESILFCFGFMLVRKYAGGFHASSYLKCQSLFIVSQMFFVFLIKYLCNNFNESLLILILLSNIVLIWIFAPVDHKNKEFNNNEYKYFKRASRICISIISVFSTIVFELFDDHKFLFSFLFGTLFATVSVGIGYLQKIINLRC